MADRPADLSTDGVVLPLAGGDIGPPAATTAAAMLRLQADVIAAQAALAAAVIAANAAQQTGGLLPPTTFPPPPPPQLQFEADAAGGDDDLAPFTEGVPIVMPREFPPPNPSHYAFECGGKHNLFKTLRFDSLPAVKRLLDIPSRGGESAAQDIAFTASSVVYLNSISSYLGQIAVTIAEDEEMSAAPVLDDGTPLGESVARILNSLRAHVLASENRTAYLMFVNDPASRSRPDAAVLAPLLLQNMQRASSAFTASPNPMINGLVIASEIATAAALQSHLVKRSGALQLAAVLGPAARQPAHPQQRSRHEGGGGGRGGRGDRGGDQASSSSSAFNTNNNNSGRRNGRNAGGHAGVRSSKAVEGFPPNV